MLIASAQDMMKRSSIVFTLERKSIYSPLSFPSSKRGNDVGRERELRVYTSKLVYQGADGLLEDFQPA